ncbi:hypothetical protein [Paenibacillus sp. P22]|uniref:hypothetical protein n=1 Tax=Paenibacillus sp. P22 TaxID=483908 RepID=UPI0004344A1B|nr:hypothetical protein [Paenibacillus sp. P22]CDN43720.1 hypothetical protein BN871_DJ_00020 [Paenibacillus sp. P22]
MADTAIRVTPPKRKGMADTAIKDTAPRTTERMYTAGGGYPQGIMPAAGAAAPGSYNYDGGGQWNAAGAVAGAASPAQWPGYQGWGAEAQGYPASPGGWPQTAAVQGYGVNPGYGGAPPDEAAPVAVQPSCCGDRDEEEAQAAEKAVKPETKSKAEAKPAKTGTAAARKQPKKAVIRSASRPAPRASKGSKPWINR